MREEDRIKRKIERLWQECDKRSRSGLCPNDVNACLKCSIYVTIQMLERRLKEFKKCFEKSEASGDE